VLLFKHKLLNEIWKSSMITLRSVLSTIIFSVEMKRSTSVDGWLSPSGAWKKRQDLVELAFLLKNLKKRWMKEIRDLKKAKKLKNWYEINMYMYRALLFNLGSANILLGSLKKLFIVLFSIILFRKHFRCSATSKWLKNTGMWSNAGALNLFCSAGP